MDNRFMQLAVESAQEGIRNEHGGPFGACIVRNGEVLSVAHNTVLIDCDPTCHAELNAIRKACKKLGTHILEGCVLYTTAEPCPMCLAGTYWARISKIVIGVTRECAGHYGFDDAAFYDELEAPITERSVETVFSVMSEDCEKVFKEWKERNGVVY